MRRIWFSSGAIFSLAFVVMCGGKAGLDLRSGIAAPDGGGTPGSCNCPAPGPAPLMLVDANGVVLGRSAGGTSYVDDMGLLFGEYMPVFTTSAKDASFFYTTTDCSDTPSLLVNNGSTVLGSQALLSPDGSKQLLRITGRSMIELDSTKRSVIYTVGAFSQACRALNNAAATSSSTYMELADTGRTYTAPALPLHLQ